MIRFAPCHPPGKKTSDWARSSPGRTPSHCGPFHVSLALRKNRLARYLYLLGSAFITGNGDLLSLRLGRARMVVWGVVCRSRRGMCLTHRRDMPGIGGDWCCYQSEASLYQVHNRRALAKAKPEIDLGNVPGETYRVMEKHPDPPNKPVVHRPRFDLGDHHPTSLSGQGGLHDYCGIIVEARQAYLNLPSRGPRLRQKCFLLSARIPALNSFNQSLSWLGSGGLRILRIVQKECLGRVLFDFKTILEPPGLASH